MRLAKGFTLIEVMIVVVVVAILGALAYPAYTGQMRRAQVQEAFSALSQFRMRMEQYYQDNRTYINAGGACGVPLPAPENARFVYNAPGCVPGAGGQAYTMTAVGNGGYTRGFTFTINEVNVRQTTTVPTDWGAFAPVNRWLEKKP